MFEAAEIGHSVDKDEFEAAVPELRVGLINAQYDLRDADFPVILLIDGDDRLGCQDALNGLHEWMDGRYLEVNALDSPSSEEAERPFFWRYWRRLPRDGRIGVFAGSWAVQAIRDRVGGRIDDDQLERRIEDMQQFEQGLADDGALLIKCWLHQSKKDHERRLKKKHGKASWRLQEGDAELVERFDDAMRVAEDVVRQTSTAEAPWQVIESRDTRYAGLRIARTILERITARLARPTVAAQAAGSSAPAGGSPSAGPTPAASRGDDEHTVLDKVDLSRRIEKGKYKKRLGELQARLSGLAREARSEGLSSVLAFEGWDAAGKGGVIRRLCAALDAKDFRVVPIAAPSEEELAHHYLWRFWSHVPKDGHVTLFDRSWYGRVLVERVEGFASEPEWRRAYSEINSFEQQLHEAGNVVLKFWLHVDADEQLRRFQAREQTPYKKHKITDEDYRNRERWHDYERAVDEMVARTSTRHAPWHLVAANDKRSARLQVIETYCEALEARL
jgi:polyphosphate:AMP phosphotransferase